MRKICEIYDISKEYDMSDNSVLVIVSELTEGILFTALPELKCYSDRIVQIEEWYEFLEINQLYNRNESKHQMREIRQSKRIESDTLMRYETDSIAEILNNAELQSKIEMALAALSPLPKSRFLKHYLEHHTYRQIAEEECKAVSTIYESIMTARKKFLKNFE